MLLAIILALLGFPSAGLAQSIANGSFETPSVGASNYQYNPTGGSWTFSGNSGVQSNGSAWVVSSAPNGTQTAFLQSNPSQGAGVTGSISQTVSFPTTGTYVLSFQAARRSSQVQPVRFSVDGVQVGALLMPTGGNFGLLTTAPFTISAAGTHTVMLAATDNSSDLSTMVDQVSITASATSAGGGEARYYPRSGLSSRMVGGKFQGSNDGSTYADLYTVASQPTDGAWTTASLSADPKAYRYLRYLAPDGSYGNIAELEFYSGTGANAVKVIGTPFGTPGSWNNQGNDFTKVFDGDITTAFDAPDPGNGDFVGIDQQSSQMALTAAGKAAGFSLSTFAAGFPQNSGGVGPLGIVFPGSTVLVTDYPGHVRVFPTDADNQIAGNTSPSIVPTAAYSSQDITGLAVAGGAIYMARQGMGQVVRVNPDGTLTASNSLVAPVPGATGIATNPANGHLFVTSRSGTSRIYDVNPATNTATAWTGTLNGPDGVTVSADGKTLYVVVDAGSSTDDILAFDTATQAQVWDYNATAAHTPISSLDGLALGYGNRSGFIYANANDGKVWQIALPGGTAAPGTATLIASGGSRGDFVAVDTSGQGSLMLVQSDRILRLFPFPAPVACAPANLSTLSLSTTTGTITLSGAALPGGQAVSLTSSNPSVLSVPASVLVPVGATSASFPVTVMPSSALMSVTVTAQYHSDPTQTASLTVDNYPKVAQGGSAVTFAAQGTDGPAGTPYYGVDVLSPSGQVVASTVTANALNGWAISDAGPYSSGSRFSVQAPAGAAMSAGYEFRASYSGTKASAFFDVVSAVTPGGGAGGGASDSISAGGMTLTPAAIARGFHLKTFATFPQYPAASAVTSSGKVFVGTFFGGRMYVLPSDQDGQDGSLAPYISNGAFGMSTVDGDHVYMTSGGTHQLNPDGTTNPNFQGPGGLDIAVNPINGHIITDNLVDIDPITGETRQFATGGGDGVAVSADGLYAFVATGGVAGYNIVTGAQEYNFSNLNHSPDGIAAGGGSLSGKIYTNNPDGSVSEIDLATGSQTDIALGGTRGDLAKIDQTNGTFLISQGGGNGYSPSLLRLIPPPGGSFGPPPGRAVYTRDDLPHSTSTTNRTLTQSYAAFGIAAPQTVGTASARASFDATGLAGTVTAALVQRAGRVSSTGAGQFDLQRGVGSLDPAILPSFGSVQPSAQTGGVSVPYQSAWSLPAPFLADLQAQLGGDYKVSLLDQLSSLCGPVNFADIPHQDWPVAKNVLTFVAAPTGGLLVPQGRCLDVLLSGQDAPLNGAWDVIQGNTIVASSGQPNGWDAEDDHTAFGGVTLTVPAGAAATNYEVRFVGRAAGSAAFAVGPAGPAPTAPLLLPLTLSAPAVVGGPASTLTGTVSLDAAAPRGQAPDAAHPAGGVYVALTTSGPALTAPAYVFIPAGQMSATFPLTTQAVSSPTSMSLMASYNGYRIASEVIIDSTTGSGIGTGGGGTGSGGGTGGGGSGGTGLGGGGIVVISLLLPPTHLTATGGDGLVTLNWAAAGTTTALPLTYNVGRSLTKSGPFALIFRGLTQPQYVDRKVTNGTIYYYVVDAALPIGESGPSNVAAATPLGGVTATPTISPNGGTFTGSVGVTLADVTPRSVLHYTLDGSPPTAASPAYSTPLTLTGNAVVSVYAVHPGSAPSAVATAAFTVNPYTPITYAPITCGQTLSGSLSASSPLSQVQGQGYSAGYYSLAGAAGETKTLTLSSSAFDGVLYLKDPYGNVVASKYANGSGAAQLTYTFQTGGAYQIEVATFAAGGAGAYSLSVTCTSGGAVSLLSVTRPDATGSSVRVVNNGTVDFGTTPAGVPVTKTFTITNSGTAPLNIGRVTVTGGSFVLVQPMSSPVAPQQSTTFVVRFAAPTAYYQYGSLSFTSDDAANTPFTVNFTGYGSGSGTHAQVPQGGGSTFALTYSANVPPGGWYIQGPTGGILATNDSAYGSPNGWTVSLASDGTTVTVTAPASATVAQGYTVLVSAGSSSNAAVFDVVASGRVLAPPTNVTATGGNHQVALTWTGALNATGYNVYRGPYAYGESPTPIAKGVTTTQFTDTSLANNTVYYYYVTAITSVAQSDRSNEVSATPTALPLPVLSGAAGDTKATLSWTAITNATGYTLYRSPYSQGPSYYQTTVATGLAATTYTNTGLSNGQTYYYTVIATDADGASASSNEISLTPAAIAGPINLMATPGNGQATLNWTAVSGATSYKIYQYYNGNGYFSVGTSSATAYTATGLYNGSSYTFAVTAITPAGESGYSNQVTVIPNALPTAPAGLQAVAGNMRIALTWTAVSGAVSYRVYRGTSANSEATTPVANNVASASYTDAGLTNGTTYFYYVTAVNGTGESIRSNEASATPAPIPAVPTALTATAGNAQVQLSWTASATAASYNVYRTTAGGTLAMISTAGAVTGTTYTDAGLTNGTTYYYVVTATNGAGSSASSNQASATPQAPPQAPIGLSATPGNTQAILSWNAPAPAVSWNPAADRVSSYTLKRSQTKGGPYTTTVTKTVNTGYTDTGLTNGTTYYYVVVATSAGGDGPASNEAAATPQVPAAGAPVITATDPDGVIIPAGGRFNGSLTVSLLVATPNAQIYYTLDGSAPSASSTLYSGASFTLSATTTVKAVAVLSGGSSSAVSSATFTLNRLPSVSLTAPVDGATLHTGDALTLAATASDSDGTILQVEFFQGTALLGKATALPYTAAWLNAPAGTYTLTAAATDKDGGRTISAPVTVTVANGLRSTPIACAQGFIGTLGAQDGTSPTLGAGHAAHLYTFTATSGTVVTLSLNSGAFAGYLALRDPSGSVVAQADAGNAGGTAQITYTVPPGAGGSYMAEVTSSAPGAGGSYTVQLDCGAAGAAPGIAVSTSSGLNVANGGTVDFGATPLGVPVTRTFTITNTGSADLALTSFGGSGDSFTATSAPSSPLPPQASTTFTVRFTPGSNGAKTGTVTLGNNTVGSPFTINLTGTGGTGPTLTVTSLMLNPTSVAGGGKSVGTVTLSGPAPAGGQAVSLASTAGASVQASVSVSPGNTSATFGITTKAVAAKATSTLTASIGTTGQPGYSSQNAVLTIMPAGTAPTVSLVANPISTGAPATITLTATASATTSGATVAKVEFFQGMTLIGQSSTSPSPYVFAWKNVPGGTYSLTAKATDSNGLTTVSSPPVSVTVTTAPALPAPTISPNGGIFASFPTVTISDINPATGQPTGATIFYTTDGTVPDTTKLHYTQPFVLPGTPITVQAKAFQSGFTPSPTAQAPFTVTAASPGSAPTVAITNPVDSTEITTFTNITGTVTSSGQAAWEMDYQLIGDSAWVPFATGTTGGGSALAVTGRLDTTLLLNGQYIVRLSAVDTAGRVASPPATVTLIVKGDQKVGYFTLTYTDMTVPIAGMPISVTRTYDSRNKSKGDFGYGWTLSTSKVSFQKPEVSGFDWVQAGGGSQYRLQAVRPHLLTFTMPNGDVYNFNETLTPNSQSYYPLDSTNVVYKQISGRPATLTPIDQNPAWVYVAAVQSDSDPNTSPSGIELYEDADLNQVYDPQQYQLALANGTKVVVDKSGGLISITDRSGNVVTFSPSDIQNIAGTQDIKISRTNGLITSITDLNRQPFLYAQSASGDLSGATDRNGNATTYDYDPQHNLTAIHAPDGSLPIANYYYPDGRLNYSLDANGKRVSYSYPSTLEAGGTAPVNSQVTTDQLGNRVQMTYDSYGNVTNWTKYLNGRAITTSYTFNAASLTNPDKPLSLTDPLGRTTYFGYNDAGDLTSFSQDHMDENGVTTTLKVTTTYNPFGEVLTTQNPNQQGSSIYQITNVYDAAGRLTTSTDALGNVTACTYNPTGSLASLTDALNYKHQYFYDTQGNVTSTIDPAGNTTTYKYDGNGKVTSTSLVYTMQATATRPQSTQAVTLQYEYDADGNQTHVVGPDGADARTHYNSLNQVDWMVDAAGRTTQFVYDGMGRQAQVSYPGGGFVKTAYDDAGNLSTFTHAAGRVTGFAYDTLYRLIQTGPINATTPFVSGQPNWLLDAANKPFSTSTVYNDDNTVASRTDANGNTTKTAYDDLSRPLSSTDPMGFKSRYSYDGLGNVLSATDANGRTTTFAYDADNRGTGSNYPDNTSNQITYDARGREIAVQDQNGRTTQYDYDAFGHVVKVTTPMSEITRFAYDETGRKISQTDANGHTTYFAYDIAGRLVQKTLPLGQYETMEYNLDSTLASMTDFNGHVTTYGYDAAGRGNAILHDDSTGVTTTYNPDGTVQQMTRTVAGGGKVVTNYGYDPDHAWLSSVQTVYGSISNTVSYGHDRTGRLAFVQGPAGKTQYAYDPDSRLQTVTSPDLKVSTYNYDKVGNRLGLTLPNGVTTTYGYDRLNRLTSLTNSAGPSYTYHLDFNGQRLTMTDSVAGLTSYAYDLDGRLTQETFPNNTSTAYAYDAAGNRKSLNGVAWAYDANDRLTNAGNTTYTYDNNGNVLTSGGATCTYDAENHLLTTGTSRYLYDAGGNRVQAVVGSTTTNYVVDTMQSYASVLEERDGSNAPVARYDYGSDRLRMDRGGAYYYVYDGLGSVRALTNAAGTVTDTYAYDAFGNTSHGLGSSPNPYAFNGQAQDASGLYFLRARYYNPGDGRFLSQDPLSGSESDPASLHRYLYASGDPVNRMDPGGMEDFSLSGVLAATGVASSLGGILDAAEFAIKDQFAAAAGVDISQEKVIAASITGNLGLGNDWVAPIQQSIQNLEVALIIFQLGSHVGDLGKAVMRAHADPPFSKFAGALADSDNSLASLAGEEESGSVEEQEAGSFIHSVTCDLCLVAGSLIQMADGTTKPIDRLQPNDLVFSRDPETGRTEPERVLDTTSRKTAVLVTLTFTDPKTGKVAEVMTCTPEHPVFVQGKGAVPAGMLNSGNQVVTRDGKPLMVEAITWQRDEKQGFTVYNLTIEDDHTYFVGKASGGVWVHNECIENRGGSFGDLDRVKDSGQVAHHMPQNAYSKGIGRSLNDGPALGMSSADHEETRTMRWKGARTNRLEADLTGRERFDNDILDIKLLFGDKYDKGLREMLNYADTLPDLSGVKSFWSPLLK